MTKPSSPAARVSNGMNALRELISMGLIGALDLHLAETLVRLGGSSQEDTRYAELLAVAFTSRAVQAGHVCLDLAALDLEQLLAEVPKEQRAEAPNWNLPPLKQWLRALRSSALVGSDPLKSPVKPLVLDEGGRLYLQRYARYQRQLASDILRRATRHVSADTRLKEFLTRLFPPPLTPGSQQQRLAAVTASRGNFTVISGGPGTGKSYTVSRVLALLVQQHIYQHDKEPEILLLAPTGKAAQRLGESIQHSLGTAALPERVLAAIPKTARTIHRALGYRPRTPTRFAHDRDNPLLADVLLVDEASMVDLALMAKLLAAAPSEAKVILLGDKDQLASVEAGAVLGDIYGQAAGAYSADFEAYAEALGAAPAATVMDGANLDNPKSISLPERLDGAAAPSSLRDSMIHLTQSRRYADGSGIGVLAHAVNNERAPDALGALAQYDDIRLLSMTLQKGLPQWPRQLEETILDSFGALARAEPEEQLRRLSSFRLLCAHRRGPFGVEALNEHVLQLLRARGCTPSQGQWFAGRPIQVTSNDYQLGLFNGDVGIISRSAQGNGVEAIFEGADGELRRLPPSRLPPHETVFAMTVHKSQGSEFDKVALILPAEPSPLLTRELVYTGLTRARKALTIYSSPEVLSYAIERRVQRSSGLQAELWGEGQQ